MKTKSQILRLALAAFLLAMPIHSLFAAPPETGIRGQTLLYEAFWVEVAPGLWLGDGWWVAYPASFRVLSAHSGREVTRVSSSGDGSFEVLLPPGKYVVVPDTFPGSVPFTGSFEVTVTAKHATDASIVYVSSPPISP